MSVRFKLGLARVTLVASVGFAAAQLIFAANAFGQEPTAPGVAEVERVIVTGSNIPTAQEVGPNPVLSLNRDFIDKSGERTTTDLLKIQPIANANSVPVQNNGTGAGGPTGAASVSLRGFDAQATLVLIDGRRVAPYPGSGFFDLNTVPLAAVQSIEILKDGASTTFKPAHCRARRRQADTANSLCPSSPSWLISADFDHV
jgi:outer membrane cobalamin receptor